MYTSLNLGLTNYREAYSFQKQCVSKVKEKTSKGFIIFTEHRPCFTFGRAFKKENLLAPEKELKQKGIDIVSTDRGGDITFHGPGQLVIYPILDLNNHGKDIHLFLRSLEKTTIEALAGFGIKAFAKDGFTGVWVEQGKIASIGIGVSHWVTYHGIAINANIDLNFFNMINACGINGVKMASMAGILNKYINIHILRNNLTASFEKNLVTI